MPVQDFALDAQGNQRIQIHWSSDSSPVSVLLNRSLLGSLATPEERLAGKDFTLPDSSILHVQIFDSQPQAFRNGYPLAAIAPATADALAERKRGGCLTTWIILNLVIISIFTLLYLLALPGTAAAGNTQADVIIFVAYGLLGCVGIVGLSTLLAWKKWGFYLVVLYVIGGIPLAFLFNVVDFRTFTPLIGLAVLYSLLRRNNVWEYLT